MMMNNENSEEGKKQGEAIICPHCEGYGFQKAESVSGSPCITCCGSGWLTKSQLEEWELENNPNFTDW